MSRAKASILSGGLIGILALWPTYQFGFICCFSPVLLSAFVGGAAGYLAASLLTPGSQDEAAETGALASLFAGAVALVGFFFSQLLSSLRMDFRYPLGVARPTFSELLQFALNNEPMLLIQRALTILIGCVFLLTIAVATGAVVGFIRGRSRALRGQTVPGA
jgi:hypothetical protein